MAEEWKVNNAYLLLADNENKKKKDMQNTKEEDRIISNSISFQCNLVFFDLLFKSILNKSPAIWTVYMFLQKVFALICFNKIKFYVSLFIHQFYSTKLNFHYVVYSDWKFFE